MQQAPTAATIIAALDRHRLQFDMSALAELDAAHSEAVRAALSGVPRKARIDLRLLLSTVKSEIAERKARKPPPDPRRYEALLISQGYEPHRPGVTPPPAAAPAADAELDDDVDDEQPRRRSVPRRRSRRKASGQKPRPRPEPKQSLYLGPKAFDQYGALARETVAPMLPPWLLDDGDPEKPDDELDDETDDDEPEEDADATTSR
jgi:hypothetical protein